jgi:DNA-binding PadR family transcriptional regulator
MRHGTLEFAVLLLIDQLGSDAHAVAIRETLATEAHRDVARGALYTTLARLEDKGLVRSRMGEPLPLRGGKARRYYTLTAAGARALSAGRADIVRAWRGLGRLLEELP